jgi:phosphatidylglycerophosphatase C
MKTRVAIYDFDGTVTTTDTLLAFIRHVFGTRRMLWGFLLHAPELVLMKLHLYDNGKAKQHIFDHFFGGESLDRFNAQCRDFAQSCSAILRPEARRTIAGQLREGWQVMVVSASVDNWVRPFFEPWATEMASDNALSVVGTQVEVKDQRLTGRFLTPNCYGPEKVRRAQEVLGAPREDCRIVAYGDSRGDRELLQWADEAHFKPFRHHDPQAPESPDAPQHPQP